MKRDLITKITWIAASVILIICGLMHLQGIFFTEDLNPNSAEALALLKSTSITMDNASNMWDLWIGFNAMFSIGLLFIGATILYLAIKHFDGLARLHFLLVLTILSNAFFVWIGYRYMITAFTVSMLVPLILFCVGYLPVLLSKNRSKGISEEV
jgi:hypothetical protein